MKVTEGLFLTWKTLTVTAEFINPISKCVMLTQRLET